MNKQEVLKGWDNIISSLENTSDLDYLFLN